MKINKIDDYSSEVEYMYFMYSADVIQYESYISNIGTIEVSSADYLSTYFCASTATKKAEVLVKKGDVVNEDDIIAFVQNKGKKTAIKCKSAGKIVNIMNDEDQNIFIDVLEYDKLEYTTHLPYEKVKDITYETEVYYYDDDEKKQRCSISFIGYELDDAGDIEFRVSPENQKNLLPGMSEKLYFVLNYSAECMALPAEAVSFRSNVGFVYVLDNDDYMEKSITVGDVFEVYDGEIIRYYYPILSGINKGDIVYSRKIIAGENEEK